jgi:hypothetical protein
VLVINRLSIYTEWTISFGIKYLPRAMPRSDLAIFTWQIPDSCS